VIGVLYSEEQSILKHLVAVEAPSKFEYLLKLAAGLILMK
jgi:hypothetical protein